MAAEGIQVSSGFTINTASFADTDFNWDSIAQANANIPAVRRYAGKPIYINETTPAETGLYFLLSDLTTWKKLAADSALNYVGAFDPSVGAVPQVIDGTANYNYGDVFVCNVGGFYNFTTGDQSPDGGGDNVITLEVGDIIPYNPDDKWEVIESVSLIQSVNGKTGVVVLVCGDIGFTNAGTSLSATDAQAAIAELDTIIGTHWDGSKLFVLSGTPIQARTELTNIQLEAYSSTNALISQFGRLGDNGYAKIQNPAATSRIILNPVDANAGANFDFNTSLILPKGTTAQRPSLLFSGLFRFNTDLNTIEFRDVSGWVQLGTSPALEDRVMFDSNLDTVRVLYYDGVLTFGNFEFDGVQIDSLNFETSLDGITWVDHGNITTPGTPPGALNTWISTNGSGKWYLRLSVVYEVGKTITTGTQWTFTRP